MPSAPPPLSLAKEESDRESDWEQRSFRDLDMGFVKEEQPQYDSPADWGWEEEEAERKVSPREVTMTPCHGGRFIRFSIEWTLFEVTARYGRPIGFIAEGSYGTVCTAFDSKTGKQVAIKKIANAFVDDNAAKMALREVTLLCHMNHRNVLAVADIVPPAEKESFDDVYITSELHPTNMTSFLRENRSHLADWYKSYVFQLLCGLKYLHSTHIVHRDLKPSNLLLASDGVLKICDFGTARIIAHADLEMTKRVGTLCYKAPEILLYSSSYSAAVDIWSVGCIFVEFIFKKTLFPGVNEENQLRLILELVGTPDENTDLSYLDETARTEVRSYPHHPRRLSEMLPGVTGLELDLIDKMLMFDPRNRITIEDALSHPYFKGFTDENNQQVCPAPSFEEQALSVQDMKDLIYQKALAFNPDFRS